MTNPRSGSATTSRPSTRRTRKRCLSVTGEPRVVVHGATEDEWIDAPRGLEVDTEGVR